MKKILFSLVIITNVYILKCQTIQLEKRQEFTYNISEQTDLKSTTSYLSPPLEELRFKRTKLHFKVLEELPEKYIIEASNELVDEYRREYFTKRKTYRTTKNYSCDLISDSSEIEYDKMLFIDKVQFELLKNGKIGEFINLDTSNFSIHPVYKMRLMSFANIEPKEIKDITDQNILMIYLSTFFLNPNIKNNKDQTNHRISLSPVYEFDEEIGTEKYTTIGKDAVSKKYGLKHPRNTGLLQSLSWKVNYQEEVKYGQRPTFNFNAVDNPIDQKQGIIYTYIQIVDVNNEPFKCKYHKFWVDPIDTVFTSTNVTIKGHIENVNKNTELSIKIENDKDHLVYPDYYRILFSLDSNNNFEIRIYTDGLKQVEFNINKQRIPIYIKPGDNIFVSFNLEDIENTLKASGIGSEDLCFMFKKHFSDKNIEAIFQKELSEAEELNDRLYIQKTKQLYLELLEEKHQFCNQFKYNISPEVYLAAFYSNQLEVLDWLMTFPKGIGYFRFLRNKNSRVNLFWNKQFYDFTYLLHPDNALMTLGLTRKNKDFLIEYMFGHLRTEIKEISGVQSLGSNNGINEDELRLVGAYEFSEMFFTGKMEHLLKNYILELIFMSGDMSLCQTYYNRFISEYPYSSIKEKTEDNYDQLKRIFPGNPMPDLYLNDMDYNKIKLSDFKGKTVYVQTIKTSRKNNLDLWMQLYFDHKPNTQLKEIKNYSNKLKNKLGDDYTFIFIDFGTNYENRKAFIYNNEDSLEGTFLIAEDARTIRNQLYHYHNSSANFIVNNQGIITNMRAPGPEELLKDPTPLLEANNMFRPDQKSRTILVFKTVSLVLIGVLLILFLLYIVSKKRAKRKQRLANLNTKVRELELCAIRAQMNPHFMYNCLNSIQNIILDNKPKEAHIYLSKFANLIRQTLKNSEKTEITLQDEMVMIQQYVELELLRFPIDFMIDINKNIDPYNIYIPPLLLQPLVENAILHGLSGKNENKKLTIKIVKKDKQICIFITDNGIGREASAKVKKPTSGKGIGFTKERLALLSEKYNTNYNFNIIDLKAENGGSNGTKVEICFTDE